jgi:pimeloyl-ACP methyl ester carboxylesterase
MPGGTFLLAQSLRLHALRRLPFTFGWMAKRPIPNEIFDAWFRPLQTQRGVRRDLSKYVHTLDKGDMLAAAERLRRINPREYGRRFAELLPHGQLIEIADSYTLIPEDQPGELARAIRQFIRDTP